MTLVREPGSEILAQFGVPTRGTWRNTAINTVPLDAVYDSLNIFVREGKLRTRPGIFTFNAAFPFDPSFSRHTIGGAMGITPTSKRMFAISTNRLHMYDDAVNVWQSIPVVAITATDSSVADIAFLETSSTYVTLFSIEGNTLMLWRPGDIAVTFVTGTNIPTNVKSVCISSSRVIALIPPHTIVWSRVLNHTNFDALAVVKRAQTPDRGICVKSLSALSFILYKETSIHTARAQAGLDEGSAFAFSEPIIVEGPAGIYAVVDVNGAHIYMTKSGRIAIFDGTNYPQWIADGILLYLQDDINQQASHLIRGVYDYRLNIVVFFYPKTGETTSMTGMVIINLPFPGFEAQEGLLPYCFLGEAEKQITHVCTKRFDDEIDSSFIFTVPEGASIPINHTFNENVDSDATIPFSCHFQTGLQAAPDARHIQVTIENFIERAFGYGEVTVIPVTSDTLETPNGTLHVSEAQIINIAIAPVNEYMGFNKKTRFFGFKYTWTSTSKVRYSGTVVYDSIQRRK